MRTVSITSAVVISCFLALPGCGDGNSASVSSEGGASGNAGESNGGSENDGGATEGGSSSKPKGGTSNKGGTSSGGTSAIGGSNAGGTSVIGGSNAGGMSAIGGSNAGGTSAIGGSGGASSTACTPENDTCPTKQYCKSAGVCVAGCKNGADCASNACLADHSCQLCISDAECANGMVCGSGTCSAVCSETSNGTGGGTSTNACSGSLNCCGTRCVDTTHDINSCGTCGTACTPGQFCSPTAGCTTTTLAFASLCAASHVTGILVENANDTRDDPQTEILVNAFSTCSAAPSMSLKGQLTGGVLNPNSGQPVSRGSMLAVAGGEFFQHLVKYLSEQSLLPIYDVWDFDAKTVTVIRRSDKTVLRTLTFAEMGGGTLSARDLLLIQVVTEPITGTPVLVSYGTDSGTPAAAWYFVNKVITDTSASSKTWVLCDWTDNGTDIGKPDAADAWLCTSE